MMFCFAKCCMPCAQIAVSPGDIKILSATWKIHVALSVMFSKKTHHARRAHHVPKGHTSSPGIARRHHCVLGIPYAQPLNGGAFSHR